MAATKSSKKKQQNPVIVITGCSSGLVLALARTLYTESYRQFHTVITARSDQSLD